MSREVGEQLAAAPLERIPATWEEYLAPGDEVRSEYIDGEIVMMQLPSLQHQIAARRLANLLEAAIPEGFGVIESWGWKAGRDEFGPDVMVYPKNQVSTDARFTGTPALCIEIVERNRSNEYVTKVRKYAEAGLDHYWILDPHVVQLDALVREGSHYRPEQQLGRCDVVELSMGVATVTVDLAALLDD